MKKWRKMAHLEVSEVGGELVGGELVGGELVGGRVISSSRNGGERGEQVMAVLVCLHHQEVAQDHGLQLLLLGVLHFQAGYDCQFLALLPLITTQ